VRGLLLLMISIPLLSLCAQLDTVSQSQTPYVSLQEPVIRWDPKGQFIASDFGIASTRGNSRYRDDLKYNPDRRIFAGCDWSPDGESLVVSLLKGTDAETPQEIWLLSRRGEIITRLVTAKFGEANIAPAWQPQGRNVAFLSYSSKRNALAQPFVHQRLCLTAVARGKPKIVIGQGVLGTTPLWSPGGRSLLVSTLSVSNDTASEAASLIVNARDGSSTRVKLKELAGNEAEHASWSPAGDSVVFGVSSQGDGPKTGLAVYHVQTRTTSTLVPCARGGGTELLYPAWSPDGRYICCTRHDPERGDQLILVEATHGKVEVRWRAAPATYITRLAWSRDGNWIAFWQSHYGKRTLWRLSASGAAKPVELK
jgi:Tol biopolymer transport system component